MKTTAAALEHDWYVESTLRSQTSLLLTFVLLQALDLITTLVFMNRGVQEANPVVLLAMKSSVAPLIGLVFVKAFAAALACVCWRSGRRRLLRKVNFGYCVLVIWNLVAIAVA